MEFSKRLLELRTEKKLSQKALAKNIGVSIGLICFWETGQSEPTIGNLIKLVKYFNVSADYLLGLQDFF